MCQWKEDGVHWAAGDGEGIDLPVPPAWVCALASGPAGSARVWLGRLQPELSLPLPPTRRVLTVTAAETALRVPQPRRHCLDQGGPVAFGSVMAWVLAPCPGAHPEAQSASG